MVKSITLNRMMLSKEEIKKIERQFAVYYFKRYQEIIDNEELKFTLQHRLKAITIKLNHNYEYPFDDTEFIEKLQNETNEKIAKTIKQFFPEKTKIVFQKIIDGLFEYSFQTSKEKGFILTSSTEVYILLEGTLKILYTILKEEDYYSITSYFLDKNYIPIGTKTIYETDFLEMIRLASFIPYEDITTSTQTFQKTMHLYKISGLNEHLGSCPDTHEKQYLLMQK